MPAPTIAASTTADHAAIARLFHDTVHAVNAVDYTPEELAAWAPPVDLARWRERVERKQPWVARADGEVVGFIELDPDGRVDCLYVHHRHQRRGVASLLLAHAAATARARGVARLWTEASITARPFFAAQGFVQVRPNLVRRGDLTLKNFLMERAL